MLCCPVCEKQYRTQGGKPRMFRHLLGHGCDDEFATLLVDGICNGENFVVDFGGAVWRTERKVGQVKLPRVDRRF
jgi:hypothetical protein